MRRTGFVLLLFVLLQWVNPQEIQAQSFFKRLFSWEKSAGSKRMQCGFMPAYNKKKSFKRHRGGLFSRGSVKKTEENRNRRANVVIPPKPKVAKKQVPETDKPVPEKEEELVASRQTVKREQPADIPAKPELPGKPKLSREALKNMTLQERRDTLSRTEPSIVLPPIQFISDQDEFSVVNMDSFMKALEYAQQGNVVLVEGHTDDLGREAYNLDLSMKRAEKIRQLLLSGGVSDELISMIGYGESQPKVPNTSDENRAINRRIEFKIFEVE